MAEQPNPLCFQLFSLSVGKTSGIWQYVSHPHSPVMGGKAHPALRYELHPLGSRFGFFSGKGSVASSDLFSDNQTVS